MKRSMYKRLLLAFILCTRSWSDPFDPADNPSVYVRNSLNSAGDVFPFYDDDQTAQSKMPSPRVHHSISYTGSFIIVYGGYHSDGSFLGDINLYHVESQRCHREERML
jgi:hypothetical protein